MTTGLLNGRGPRPNVPIVSIDASFVYGGHNAAPDASAVRLERSALERMYDPAPEPVVLVEPDDGRLLYCNQSFVDLCQLRPRAARRLINRGGRLGEVIELDHTWHIDEFIRRAAHLDHALGASSVRSIVLGEQGRDLVVTLTAVPINTFDDQGPAVLITFRDTTAEHRVQAKYHRLLVAKKRYAAELESRVRDRTRELAETQEELLQATRLAAIGEVAGAAAHEVFNPLTAIAGNLSRLQQALADEQSSVSQLRRIAEREPSDGGEREPGGCPRRDIRVVADELEEDLQRRRKTLATVCNASHRIERIVQGMLSMARAEPEPESLKLKQVFREVRDLMAYSFERSGVELDVESSTDLEVFADRGELLQVLTNLIRNGCQAANSAHGTRGGRVSTRAAASAQFVTIRVEDNGVGVPKEIQGRIFESGFTTKPHGEGSGLGLSISRRLIRRNGGDLILHSSSPAAGTVMRLTLPDSSEAPRD